MPRILNVFAVSLCISFILCSLSFAQAKPKETLVIETYYPSPYGVYNEMKLYPHSPATTSCSSIQEGLMYYDSSTHALNVCMCTNPPGCSTYAWASSTGYWTLSGANLYPNNTAWNVGIGTTNPLYNLEVVSTSSIGAVLVHEPGGWSL